MRLGDLVKWTVVTLLSWLGLAGIADNVLEWQRWFDIGVLQHWTSIKVWVSVVLFSWLPFQIPSWILDYFAAGSVVARATHIDRERILLADANLRARLSVRQWAALVKEESDDEIIDTFAAEIPMDLKMRTLWTLSAVTTILLTIIFWPLVLVWYLFSISRIVKHSLRSKVAAERQFLLPSPFMYDDDPNSAYSKGLVKYRKAFEEVQIASLKSTSKGLAISVLGFIPFLFVASTLLYEFG